MRLNLCALAILALGVSAQLDAPAFAQHNKRQLRRTDLDHDTHNLAHDLVARKLSAAQKKKAAALALKKKKAAA